MIVIIKIYINYGVIYKQKRIAKMTNVKIKKILIINKENLNKIVFSIKESMKNMKKEIEKVGLVSLK